MSITVALEDTAKIVHIKHATKDHTYSCLNCEDKLIPKQGIKIAHHFSHHSGVECVGESYLHKVAKLVLIEYLTRNRSIVINRHKHAETSELIAHVENISSDATIKQEYRLDNGNIADVAVISDDKLIIFEVLVTHKTKEGSRPEPWYELLAEDIIDERENERTIPFWDQRQLDSPRMKAGKTVLDFGQNKGKMIKDVPITYIHYLTQKFPFINYKDKLVLAPKLILSDGDRFLLERKPEYKDQACLYMKQKCYGCKGDLPVEYENWKTFCKKCYGKLLHELSMK